MSAKVTQLQPNTVKYKGYIIKLTHRPKTNDWTYSINVDLPLTLSNKAPRYQTALSQAKAEIDKIIEHQSDDNTSA